LADDRNGRGPVSFFMNKFRKLGFIAYNGGIEGGIEIPQFVVERRFCTTSRKSRLRISYRVYAPFYRPKHQACAAP